MTREQLKKELSNYSKDEIIEVLMLSAVATGFVIEKCKALYGVKTDPNKKKPTASKKEAAANDK